jgi:hypothetical protein
MPEVGARIGRRTDSARTEPAATPAATANAQRAVRNGDNLRDPKMFAGDAMTVCSLFCRKRLPRDRPNAKLAYPA